MVYVRKPRIHTPKASYVLVTLALNASAMNLPFSVQERWVSWVATVYFKCYNRVAHVGYTTTRLRYNSFATWGLTTLALLFWIFRSVECTQLLYTHDTTTSQVHRSLNALYFLIPSNLCTGGDIEIRSVYPLIIQPCPRDISTDHEYRIITATDAKRNVVIRLWK